RFKSDHQLSVLLTKRIRVSGFFICMPKPVKTTYDLVIIGAGPAGLACAIEASKAGLDYCVFDQGSVADAIRRFPVQMTFFSTPDLLQLGNIPFISSGFRPSRSETVKYYQSVSSTYRLEVIRNARVTGLTKTARGFQIASSIGFLSASRVVVATGYFDTPNPFEVPGADLPNVYRYYDEGFRYAGLEVAVVGGKNSAVETALDLYRHGAKVTMIHRGERLSEGVKYWILPDLENRIKAGEITALFQTRVRRIRPGVLEVEGRTHAEIPFAALFVMIGYRPETALLEQAGVSIDPDTLGPVHDPATMETNVGGLYVAGSLAAGKYNNKIFIENGRLHGAMIVSALLKK
ncbi:MAG: YpdA family putative bacillithiol disulfide reductase, partial [Bacteroidota bacterium]